MTIVKYSLSHIVAHVAFLCVLVTISGCGKQQAPAAKPAQKTSSAAASAKASNDAQAKKAAAPKKKQSRWRRKIANKKPKKTVRTMNYQELKEAAARAVAHGDKKGAIVYKKKMIAICDTPEDLCGLTLDIADHLYDLQDAVMAGKMYLEFTKLYPGSAQAEYALHRAIVCSFAQTLDTDRDQTKTRETIELAESFLARVTFAAHRPAVKNILAQCRRKLFESETNIIAFYTHRGDYKAAQRRIDQIRTHASEEPTPGIPFVLSDIEATLVALECGIAHKQSDEKLLGEKRDQLVALLGAEKASLVVAANTSSRSFLDRF